MHPLTGDLPAGWLRRLAPHARPVYRRAGHRLTRQDTPAEQFWLLHSGTVVIDLHVPGRGDVVLEELGAGTTVGWSWLVAPYRWQFGAVVTDDIRALEFNAAGIRALIAENDELGRELSARFLSVVADRLRTARHRLVGLYAYPADTT
ncbi:hypothetical protein Ari01nite_96540 [Paractinoplanes rishiriensis]|uniref:Cyclic nucleotide-binding domain-containing protein n=1 Tax=Paractinoplanes rishiriensis TaxID=1050105 RepID=A0A919N073_9ACTN|nr:hypothetical protein Ari01nite_96540 [Actinoplanes rishiriensis]